MKILIEELYNNRLLRTYEELEKFEENLNTISKVVKESDIPDLCKVFDYTTKDDEVMFCVIHLIEIFSSEKAFELIVIGIANMMTSAIGWDKIIIYRCLNNNFSREMLKKAINSTEFSIQQEIISLLNIIKTEDFDKFGMLINQVLS